MTKQAQYIDNGAVSADSLAETGAPAGLPVATLVGTGTSCDRYGDFDGKRGVHVPEGMSREEIVGVARIIHDTDGIAIDRYLANQMAREILVLLHKLRAA